MLLIVVLVAIGSFLFYSCTGKSQWQTDEPGQLRQTASDTAGEQEQVVPWSSTTAQAQAPVPKPFRKGDVYYEFQPVFAPKEIRRQMVGTWRFHPDSVKVEPFLGRPEFLQFAIPGDFDVIIKSIQGETDSVAVSIPALFPGEFVRMEIYSPAYESGDEDEDGYADEYFADFQLGTLDFVRVRLLTGFEIASLEGIFVSSQEWRGKVAIQGLLYFGTARRVQP